jgi:predicted ATPase with chaperone activity
MTGGQQYWARAMNLKARAYHPVLKLARMMADPAGSERIQPAHLTEAIHLRSAAADGVESSRGATNRPHSILCQQRPG